MTPPAPSMIGIERQHVIRLEFGLDNQIDMAGGEHAIGVAIAAIARQPHRRLDALEAAAVRLAHQQRTGREQHGVLERPAGARAQRPLAGGAAITGGAAVAGEMFAREWLMHHAVDRLAAPCQRDQRAPCRHAADEGFGAVDRIEHPDIFGVGSFGAEFFADDAVRRKRLLDQCAHGDFGSAVGGRHWIEAAGRTLVLDAERGAKERTDRLAGDAR